MLDLSSSSSPTRVLLGCFVVVMLLPGSTLRAQARNTIGFGFGPVASYPSDFGGSGCDATYVAANVGIGHAISRTVAIEGNVAWTGSMSTSCYADALSRPAPEDGDLYHRTETPDAIPGETFWATGLGAVVTPWEFGNVVPLVRVSGGRLWSKGLWTWTWGGGVRYAFGRQRITLSADRWHLGYEISDETWVYREGGPDELRARETLERTPRPWFLRVGWEVAVR